MDIRETLLGKQLYIFDLDGTVYLGQQVFPFAVQFIRHLRESGRRVLFFTNNASRSGNDYVIRLASMGFEPHRDEIMTAGDVTEAYLRRHYPHRSVYVLGTESLRSQFAEGGINVAGEGTDPADVVVSSFDTELTYAKLCRACRLISAGAVWLCTHPDLNCPSEQGDMPDSGSLAALITASTGKTPVMLGKPNGVVVDMIELVTGVSREHMCVFGDRLYTDIAMGVRHGMCSILVLTGETTQADVTAASPVNRPTYVLPSLKEADELMFGTNAIKGDPYGI